MRPGGEWIIDRVGGAPPPALARVARGSLFWATFAPVVPLGAGVDAAATAGEPFTLRGLTVATGGSIGSDASDSGSMCRSAASTPPASSSARRHGVFTAAFDPLPYSDESNERGSVGGGSEDGGSVGGGGGGKRYRVTLRTTHSDAPPRARTGAPPVAGLVLGPLLGRGSSARVYRGSLNGAPVAVKVCGRGSSPTRAACCAAAATDAPSCCPPPEATAAAAVRGHPNLVACLAHARGAGGEPWLVLELCNGGALGEAAERGLFCSRSGGGAPSPSPTTDHAAVAARMADVAAGLAALHAASIVHGDLAGGNVLLCSTAGGGSGHTMPTSIALHPGAAALPGASPARAYIAKLADFGLAKRVDAVGEQGRASAPHPPGTITHQPPERLAGAPPSPAADIYGLGVLAWTALTGQRPWAGLAPAQVMHAVGCDGRTLPPLPHDTPSELASLVTRCLASDPAARPSAAAAVGAFATQASMLAEAVLR